MCVCVCDQVKQLGCNTKITNKQTKVIHSKIATRKKFDKIFQLAPHFGGSAVKSMLSEAEVSFSSRMPPPVQLSREPPTPWADETVPQQPIPCLVVSDSYREHTTIPKESGRIDDKFIQNEDVAEQCWNFSCAGLAMDLPQTISHTTAQ